MGIMTREKLPLILVAISPGIYWSDRLSGRRRWNSVWMGLIVILASYKFHIIREHENLEEGPSNNKSI